MINQFLRVRGDLEPKRVVYSTMSIVPSGTDTSATLKELPALITRWLKVQEEMAALNNEMKSRRTQGKALKDVILRIMESSGYNNLKVNKGIIVHKTHETPEKISNDYLLKHFKEFFSGDEEKAKTLVTYLEERRTKTVKHDLRLQAPKEGDDVITNAS